MVREHILLFYLDALRCPRSLDDIVVFVIADGDRVVDDIADCLDLGFQRNIFLSCRVEEILLLLVEGGFLLEQFVGVLLGLEVGSWLEIW